MAIPDSVHSADAIAGNAARPLRAAGYDIRHELTISTDVNGVLLEVCIYHGHRRIGYGGPPQTPEAAASDAILGVVEWLAGVD